MYSRRMKYEIEEVVEEFGGKDVQNNIRVGGTQAPQGLSSSQGGSDTSPSLASSDPDQTSNGTRAKKI